MDWVLVCVGLIAFNIILTVWLFRQLVFTMDHVVGQLDENIGLAIQKLIEGGLGDIEPMNPIQQAIGQMLMNNVNQTPIEAVIRDRAPDGKFSG